MLRCRLGGRCGGTGVCVSFVCLELGWGLIERFEMEFGDGGVGKVF